MIEFCGEQISPSTHHDVTIVVDQTDHEKSCDEAALAVDKALVLDRK